MSYLGDCTRCGSPVDYASDGNGRIWHRRGRCPRPAAPGPSSAIQAAGVPALPRTASPIERLFWDAYREFTPDLYPEIAGLVPQHPAGRYRLDFALPGRRTGIELDGFASHSSTRAIASDRQRQRDLERAGWRIIRFGGSEVYHDAAECVRQAASLVRSWTEGGER